MAGKLLPIMWPAYLAALLLSLPASPVQARDGGPRSTLDRAHLGEEAPPAGRTAQAALPDEEDEDERDGEG